MHNNKIYSIGQRINAIDTKQAGNGSAGKITDAYIGADGMIHFRSRNKQPLKAGVNDPGLFCRWSVRLYMALSAQLYAD